MKANVVGSPTPTGLPQDQGRAADQGVYPRPALTPIAPPLRGVRMGRRREWSENDFCFVHGTGFEMGPRPPSVQWPNPPMWIHA